MALTNPIHVRDQLAYYGIPAHDITAATDYALELIGDRGELDLAEFASEWMRLPKDV